MRGDSNGQHRRTNPSLYGGPNYGTGAGYSAGSFFTSAVAVLTISSITRSVTASAVLTITGPRTPVEYGGIKVGEIEAWRIWYLRNDGYLESIVSSVVWLPGNPMTGDVTYDGVFSWKTSKDARAHGRRALEMGSLPVIGGRIALWGEVIEHEHGYRAEYAKIIGLDYGWGRNIDLHQLRFEYGLPDAETRRPNLFSRFF